MQYTTTEIAERIRPIVERYEIPEVYLFGSYARGDMNSDSDIDILIKRRGSIIFSAFDLGALFNDLKAALGQEIDLVTLESFEFDTDSRGMKCFSESLSNDRVLIYEKRRILNTF
jgi:predicted nucleotidyltransferase